MLKKNISAAWHERVRRGTAQRGVARLGGTQDLAGGCLAVGSRSPQSRAGRSPSRWCPGRGAQAVSVLPHPCQGGGALRSARCIASGQRWRSSRACMRNGGLTTSVRGVLSPRITPCEHHPAHAITAAYRSPKDDSPPQGVGIIRRFLSGHARDSYMSTPGRTEPMAPVDSPRCQHLCPMRGGEVGTVARP